MVFFRCIITFLSIACSVADRGLQRVKGCIVAPKICPSEHIDYYLYTSANPTAPVKIDVSDSQSIKEAKFLQAPIKFIIHGYTGHKDGFVNTELRSAYFKRPEDVNIVIIDYGALVRPYCYIQAVMNTDLVAMCTAQFLESLLKTRQDIQLSKIHFIAFSMGAHVAGRISTHFTMGQIERITALDAAFPGYTIITRAIQQGDAKFIDALHTNAGMRGKPLPYADIDFYANGGTFQPPCSVLNTTCCHTFSISLFAESIVTKVGFRGQSCSYFTYSLGYCAESDQPQQLFGEHVDQNARGTYYFKTADTAPYALTKNNGLFN